MITLRRTDFLEKLEKVNKMTSKDNTKNKLSKVYLVSKDNQLDFVATDSFALAHFSIKDFTEDRHTFNEGVLLHRDDVTKIVKMLKVMKSNYIDISRTEQDLVINVEHEGIYLDIKVVYTTDYISYESVFRENDTQFYFDKEELLSAFSIFNRYRKDHRQTKEPYPITIDIKPEGSTISINAEHTHLIAVGSETGKLKAKFGISGFYLETIVKSFDTDQVIIDFKSKDDTLYVYNYDRSGGFYIVMPMDID